MENENNVPHIQEPTYWQQLRYRLMRWWLLTFRNKTLWKGEIGGFRYRMRRYWLDIRSAAPQHWNLRLGIANNAYGLLLGSIYALQKYESDGNEEKVNDEKKFISDFSMVLYQTSAYLPSDMKFAKGLKRELDWAYNRLIRKAKEEANKVTKEQEDAEQAFMESVVQRGNMTRQQRRKAESEERKAMRKVAAEIVNDTNSNSEV